MNKEFKKAEYELAINTYKTQISLGVQVITALLLASITSIGFAIDKREAWIFLIGGFISFAAAVVIKREEKGSRYPLIRAVEIEKELGDSNPSLATSWIYRAYGEKGYDEVAKILNEKHGKERFRAIEKNLIPNTSFKITVALFIIFSVLQFLLSGLAPMSENWIFY